MNTTTENNKEPTIGIQLVKELRNKTSSSFVECKKALVVCDGDLEKAVEWLKEQGLVKLKKLSGGVARMGAVCALMDKENAIVLEVNSVTDFVGKNETFQAFVKEVAKQALKGNGNLEDLKKGPYGNGHTVEEELSLITSGIGEKIDIRRLEKINIKDGKGYLYVHNVLTPGLGQRAAMVVLDKEPLDKELGNLLAMHIVASTPKSLSRYDLDPTILAAEKATQLEVIEQSGKPKEIFDKILEGKMNKYFESIVLLEQDFNFTNDDKACKVSKILKDNGVNIVNYAYLVLGEGIEEQVNDFAADVAKMIQ
ncbi:Elongation factor Ts [Candidatus Hepatincolaceae symbiont of Richtersius coronifer]